MVHERLDGAVVKLILSEFGRIVVHEGVDGATVELIDLKKVNLIYTNPGCCWPTPSSIRRGSKED